MPNMEFSRSQLESIYQQAQKLDGNEEVGITKDHQLVGTSGNKKVKASTSTLKKLLEKTYKSQGLKKPILSRKIKAAEVVSLLKPQIERMGSRENLSVTPASSMEDLSASSLPTKELSAEFIDNLKHAASSHRGSKNCKDLLKGISRPDQLVQIMDELGPDDIYGLIRDAITDLNPGFDLDNAMETHKLFQEQLQDSTANRLGRCVSVYQGKTSQTGKKHTSPPVQETKDEPSGLGLTGAEQSMVSQLQELNEAKHYVQLAINKGENLEGKKFKKKELEKLTKDLTELTKKFNDLKGATQAQSSWFNESNTGKVSDAAKEMLFGQFAELQNKKSLLRTLEKNHIIPTTQDKAAKSSKDFDHVANSGEMLKDLLDDQTIIEFSKVSRQSPERQKRAIDIANSRLDTKLDNLQNSKDNAVDPSIPSEIDFYSEDEKRYLTLDDLKHPEGLSMAQRSALLDGVSGAVALDPKASDYKLSFRFTNTLGPADTGIDIKDPNNPDTKVRLNANRFTAKSGERYIPCEPPKGDQASANYFRLMAQEGSQLVLSLTRPGSYFKDSDGNTVKGDNTDHHFPSEVGEELSFNDGRVTIKMDKVESLPLTTSENPPVIKNKGVIQSFTVNVDGQAFPVKRINYTGWPDFGAAPANELIQLRSTTKAVSDGMGLNLKDNPLMVNCRASQGRTGNAITAFEVMAQLDQNPSGEHNIGQMAMQTSLQLRKARGPAIQTKEQARSPLLVGQQYAALLKQGKATSQANTEYMNWTPQPQNVRHPIPRKRGQQSNGPQTPTSIPTAPKFGRIPEEQAPQISAAQQQTVVSPTPRKRGQQVNEQPPSPTSSPSAPKFGRTQEEKALDTTDSAPSPSPNKKVGPQTRPKPLTRQKPTNMKAVTSIPPETLASMKEKIQLGGPLINPDGSLKTDIETWKNMLRTLDYESIKTLAALNTSDLNKKTGKEYIYSLNVRTSAQEVSAEKKIETYIKEGNTKPAWDFLALEDEDGGRYKNGSTLGNAARERLRIIEQNMKEE